VSAPYDLATVCCKVPCARIPIAVATLAIALAGCGGGKLERKQVADVKSALRSAGLEICETGAPDEPPETAEDEQSIAVAVSCSDDEDEATVVLIAWPDRGARDAALRRFDVQSRPSAQNHGNTWAYGQFTIHVSGERNEDAVDRVVDAMDALGAS
jgi:hypothetical protein